MVRGFLACLCMYYLMMACMYLIAFYFPRFHVAGLQQVPRDATYCGCNSSTSLMAAFGTLLPQYFNNAQAPSQMLCPRRYIRSVRTCLHACAQFCIRCLCHMSRENSILPPHPHNLIPGVCMAHRYCDSCHVHQTCTTHRPLPPLRH